MEIDRLVLVQLLEGLALLRLGEARIIKAAAVLGPFERGELHPLHLVGGRLAARDVEHFDGPPIGSAILDRVEEMFAILARYPFGERGGAIGRPCVGVDEHPGRPTDAFADVEHRLVLKPVVAGVEVTPALLFRHSEPLIIV